jgi:hypothetical protein
MENPAALSPVVQEIITVGGMMILVVVIFWAILVVVTAKMAQHSKQFE